MKLIILKEWHRSSLVVFYVIRQDVFVICQCSLDLTYVKFGELFVNDIIDVRLM